MAENQFIKGAESATRFEVRRYGYSLAFEISPDALECRCFYEPATTGGGPLTESELQAHLTQFKIREGIIPDSTASLVNAAATAKAVSGLLLAQGVPMVPGEDGQIVMCVSDDLAEAESEEEGAATVDFRHVQKFMNVEVGELVAMITPHGLGKPGRTVTGITIPPQIGTPVKFELGQNVHLSDDGRSIISEAVGRVYWRESAISVEDIYEIEGDVDFKVGNIAFKGYVEVKGDVLDGFSVKTTRGIKVHGIIGVCTIESDGDISFSGMNGQGTGTITCGGSISTNYIYETSIECAGDVVVDVEIRNAQIRALGAIRVNRRGISGGEYFALAGIESFFLGNVISLPTRVVAGVHYRDLEELNRLFNALKELIVQFNASPKETDDVKAFARKRAAITEQTNEVRSRTYDQSNPKINVHKVLYEGVNITLGRISEIIKEARKGPISVIENTIDGGFRLLGMTPLSFNAQMIEQTFIQQCLLEQQKSRSQDSVKSSMKSRDT